MALSLQLSPSRYRCWYGFGFRSPSYSFHFVPCSSPHTLFTAPISYFAFHVHHVAVDVALFSSATFVPFHIQSLYFMFGLLIQSLDALCSKLLSFDVFVMRFFGCHCFLSNSFNLSNARAPVQMDYISMRKNRCVKWRKLKLLLELDGEICI